MRKLYEDHSCFYIFFFYLLLLQKWKGCLKYKFLLYIFCRNSYEVQYPDQKGMEELRVRKIKKTINYIKINWNNFERCSCQQIERRILSLPYSLDRGELKIWKITLERYLLKIEYIFCIKKIYSFFDIKNM